MHVDILAPFLFVYMDVSESSGTGTLYNYPF